MKTGHTESMHDTLPPPSSHLLPMPPSCSSLLLPPFFPSHGAPTMDTFMSTAQLDADSNMMDIDPVVLQASTATSKCMGPFLYFFTHTSAKVH